MLAGVVRGEKGSGDGEGWGINRTYHHTADVSHVVTATLQSD